MNWTDTTPIPPAMPCGACGSASPIALPPGYALSPAPAGLPCDQRRARLSYLGAFIGTIEQAGPDAPIRITVGWTEAPTWADAATRLIQAADALRGTEATR